MIKLTASQIKELDEISSDKNSIDHTLKIAMNFHANRASEIRKDEKKWWDEVGAIHGLDMYEKNYKVDRKNACMIIEVTEDKS